MMSAQSSSVQPKKIMIVILALVMVMELLDGSVLNTALPQIAKSLQVSPILLKVAITTYLLSIAIFIPMNGWLNDRIGERKTLLWAIVIFLFGSLGCALSINVPMLVIFRIIQGAGGAFLMPTGRLLLVRTYPKDQIVRVMTFVTSITILGTMSGPVMGGAIATYLNWRLIFLVNFPIGLVALCFIYRVLNKHHKPIYKPFDLLGFILLGSALGLIMLCLDTIVDPSISLFIKTIFFCVAVILVITYIRHTRRVKYPLVHLQAFQDKTFKFVSLGSMNFRLCAQTIPFLVPLMLQATYGYSAFESGLFILAGPIGSLLSRRFLSVFIARLGYRRLFMINTGVMCICFASYTLQAWHLIIPLLLVQQLIFGFSAATQYTTMNSLAYQNLSGELQSQGMTIYSGITQLSRSFGIAIAALVMVLVIGHVNLTQHIPNIAFKVVFLVQTIFLGLSLTCFYQLPRQKM